MRIRMSIFSPRISHNSQIRLIYFDYSITTSMSSLGETSFVVKTTGAPQFRVPFQHRLHRITYIIIYVLRTVFYTFISYFSKNITN